MTLLAVLLFLPFLHLAIAFSLVVGIHRRYRRRHDEPRISVVVPVRNEETSLPNLLNSLLALDYPAEKMEIIIVNDESEDRTGEVAESYRDRFACDFRVVDADHSRERNLTAKTLPLTQGIDVARGEFILMTDGDCVVPPSWVRSVTSHFTEGVGVVCGVTLPDLERRPGFPMTWLEAVDWSYLLGVCAGFASLGRPLALIGNNYAVRRAAYEDLGTFRRMEFNSIDDIALQHAVQKSKRWSIAFPVGSETVVRTLPMGGIAAQARQRRRWAKGKDTLDSVGQMILAFAVLTHMTWPLWILLWGWAGLLGAILIALGDYHVILATMLKVRVRRPLFLMLLYPLYTLCYGWMMVYYLMRGRTVEWKSRPFQG